MSEQSTSSIHVSPGVSLPAWIWKLIPVIIIIVIVIVAYYFIMSSPLGKGVSSLLGGVGGVLEAVGDQLKTCNEDGYFNTGKGCWLGFLGLGAGLLYIGAGIAKELGITGKISDSLRSALTRGSAISGDSIGTEMSEMSKNIDYKKIFNEETAAKYEPKVLDYAAEKVAISTENKLNIKRLKTNSKSPEEFAKDAAAENKAYEANLESTRLEATTGEDALTEEQMEEADTFASDNGFEPPPVEFL
jgi:hypothetical protein